VKSPNSLIQHAQEQDLDFRRPGSPQGCPGSNALSAGASPSAELNGSRLSGRDDKNYASVVVMHCRRLKAFCTAQQASSTSQLEVVVHVHM
jgi:hypothetical protein